MALSTNRRRKGETRGKKRGVEEDSRFERRGRPLSEKRKKIL
jgi:hypothetical protein